MAERQSPPRARTLLEIRQRFIDGGIYNNGRNLPELCLNTTTEEINTENDQRSPSLLSYIVVQSDASFPNMIDILLVDDHPGFLRIADINFDARCSLGWTALHYAAASGHMRAVKRLLECGAQLDVRNNKGDTPFGLACKLGRADVVWHFLASEILSLGVWDYYLERANNEGKTPYVLAGEDPDFLSGDVVLRTRFETAIGERRKLNAARGASG